MPLRAPPIKESPAWEIYTELLKFVAQNQAIPNEHALYMYVMRPLGYGMSLGQFRYNFLRLERAGYIRVEEKTRAIQICKAQIQVPEDP
jgi:hypothetical protein